MMKMKTNQWSPPTTTMTKFKTLDQIRKKKSFMNLRSSSNKLATIMRIRGRYLDKQGRHLQLFMSGSSIIISKGCLFNNSAIIRRLLCLIFVVGKGEICLSGKDKE